MSILDLPALAQAQPEEIEVTVAQGAAALMTLGMLLASLCMIVIWIIRYLNRDCLLPAADRGVLRCPVGATTVAVVMTLLMGLMGILSSVMPEPASPVVADAASSPDQLAAETSVEQPPELQDTDDTQDAEGNATGPEKLRARFITGIQLTLLMDVFLLVVFGVVIVVYLPTGLAPVIQSHSEAPANDRDAVRAEVVQPQTLWPDLDVQPGDGALSQAEQSVGSPEADLGPANPFAAPLDANDQHSAPVMVGNEPLNFLVELRFACEVFAVAILPTTALRLIIVLLYNEYSGTDEIPQHPFLELMRSGIDVPVLLLISFMAVVMAPVMEELLYRVVIMGGFAQHGRTTLGLWVSSVLFGLAHGFPDCIALLPLAFLLGYTYIRRRSYVAVMLVHFLFNAFNLTVAGLGLL